MLNCNGMLASSLRDSDLSADFFHFGADGFPLIFFKVPDSHAVSAFVFAVPSLILRSVLPPIWFVCMYVVCCLSEVDRVSARMVL